jgi:hypothetical protein
MEKIQFLILRNLINNEEYFTEEVMEKLDEIAKKEFSYG